MNHVSGRTAELGEIGSAPSRSESSESTESESSTEDSGWRGFCCSRGQGHPRIRHDSSRSSVGRSRGGFVVEALHGVSQVCFITNSTAGAVFLVAVLAGKPRMAIILGLIGVLSATAVSLFIGLDVEARRDGTLGYNGMLVGCAFAFAVPDFWWAVPATLVAASMSAFVAAALLLVVRPQLTLAFNFAALSTLAIIHLANEEASSAKIHGVTGISFVTHLSGLEFIRSTMSGIAQIFFVDSPISGLVILLGIGLKSPFMSLSTLLGSVVATLGAACCGADLPRFHQGIWGYNAALTALWISSHFRSLGYFPGLVLVCCGAAAATATFAGMDLVVGMLHGFAPACFTLPFNAVGLFLVALQRLTHGIQSLTKSKSPASTERWEASE